MCWLSWLRSCLEILDSLFSYSFASSHSLDQYFLFVHWLSGNKVLEAMAVRTYIIPTFHFSWNIGLWHVFGHGMGASKFGKEKHICVEHILFDSSTQIQIT